MIEVEIPGYKTLRLTTLISDFNGTLAVDGVLDDAVRKGLLNIASSLELVVVTADTHGTVRQAMEALPVRIIVLDHANQVEAKRKAVEEADADSVVFFGNGANDVGALSEAALSIVVLGEEGASGEALRYADLVVKKPVDAVHLLSTPKRLIAGLRR